LGFTLALNERWWYALTHASLTIFLL
jgi:hypothetical protein